MNFDIPKFVINLKYRKDRLEKFKNSIDFEVETIYGFDKNESSEIFNSVSNCLNNGEKGCFLSHLFIYKKIINENIPYAIIFEDDAIFCENFKIKLTHILNEISNFDILYIGGRFDPDFRMETWSFLPVSENIVKFIDVPFQGHDQKNFDRTTHAYIISNQLASKLIDKYNNCNTCHQIDHFIIKYCMDNNITILSTYPLLCHSPANSPDSNVQNL
jgi:glycosyl transferase family 25